MSIDGAKWMPAAFPLLLPTARLIIFCEMHDLLLQMFLRADSYYVNNMEG